MIISASRRTDIPALYSEWFMNRLGEGFVLVPNPYNRGRIGRVALSPENVDCIVFWTKNPAPMMSKYAMLDAMGYKHYTQFTLTPYVNALEPKLPAKAVLLDSFIKMAEITDPARSVWRYDPVIIDERHCVNWHIEQFTAMCGRLRGYTQRCVISFIDLYKTMKGSFRAVKADEMYAVAAGFAEAADRCGITLYTCAEAVDLSMYGIKHSACIDKKLVEQIVGRTIKPVQDKNQRSGCNCVESVDIGVYNTCDHACTYCYATYNLRKARMNAEVHDPKAPMLTGYPKGDEIITDRKASSQNTPQPIASWEDFI